MTTKIILPMIFYPSGNLHLGHIRTYSFLNAVQRYYQKILNHKTVFPIGGDCFGLPTSNKAKELGMHPQDVSNKFFNSFVGDLKKYNFNFDWDYCIRTDSPEYIKWLQSKIIKLYKAGYLYSSKSIVNFDPLDKEYLSNEQCPNGICWRSGAKVEYRLENAIYINIKLIEKDLYTEISNLHDWCPLTLNMQKRWIGLKNMLFFVNTKEVYKIPKNEKIYLNNTLEINDYPSIDFRSHKLIDLIGEVELKKVLNIGKYPFHYKINHQNS